MRSDILDRIRDRYDAIRSRVDDRWIYGAVGIAVLVGIIFFLSTGAQSVDPAVVQLTIDAAATATSARIPGLVADLSSTPPEAALTGAAPTLVVGGRNTAAQFAASATATSQLGEIDWSAVQLSGPPNTPECGEFRTAWSPANPNTVEVVTVYFPELVYPTGLQVYQTANPGFINQITITDVFGEVHSVYEAVPQLLAACPYTLMVSIPPVDYPANIVTIYIDQSFSPGRVGIDAVEMLGIRY